MRWSLVMLAALVVGASFSCRHRPLGATPDDAGVDVSSPSMTDAARADVAAEARADAAADVAADLRADVTADATADTSGDVTVDAAAAVCPAGIASLDVCGCGCCGEAMGRACYYPSRGETRDAIPNPIPPPTNCAMAGCSFGVRHICCADPGVQPETGTICAIDTSIEDLPRFTITRRDGDVCTVLEVGSASAILPIAGPPSRANVNGWRGPCDGSTPPVFAIGGLGSVTPGTSGTLLPFPRFSVHVVLFFDARTGIADAVRIDRDEIGVAPRCASAVCPSCGTVCVLDAGYAYGYVGGRAPFRNTVMLAPPASFMHIRSPLTTMPPDMACAPPFPACGATAIDVGDVMAAILDPDVQEALQRSKGAGTIPFYGMDQRPIDGQAFQITRDGGGGFLVGSPCPPGANTSCMTIPAGLTRLVSRLTALDQQQLADPSCAFSPP